MQQVSRIAVAKNRSKSGSANDNRLRVVREAVDPVTGQTISVARIVSSGGVDHMHAKGRVTDRQKAAADRFQALYEMAHSDGLRAIDYSRVRVDGSAGSGGTGVDRAIRALRELEALRGTIGDKDYAVLLTVVVRGWSIRQIGRAIVDNQGGDESWKRELATRSLLRALDALDNRWNVAVGTGRGMRADILSAGKEGVAPIVEARTNGDARNESRAAKTRDIAMLEKEGLA